MASTVRGRRSSHGAMHVKKMWMGLLVTVVLAVCASRSGADKNAHVRAVQDDDDSCPEIEYVYPYWSLCDEPLQYFEAVHLVSGTRGGLEAVGTSSPWNVVSFTRSSELLGETYIAVPVVNVSSEAVSGDVPVNSSVALLNSQTKLPLTWIFHPWFRGSILAQATSNSSDYSIATFRFLTADNTSTSGLACPTIANARCESYTLVSDSVAPLGIALNEFSPVSPTVLVPFVNEETQEALTFQVIRPSSSRAFI